jgi:hypothetical protein
MDWGAELDPPPQATSPAAIAISARIRVANKCFRFIDGSPLTKQRQNCARGLPIWRRPNPRKPGLSRQPSPSFREEFSQKGNFYSLLKGNETGFNPMSLTFRPQKSKMTVTLSERSESKGPY